MRLIDAEALKEDLTELMAVNGELIDEWFAGCIIDTVNEQPIKAIIEDTDIRAKLAVWAHMLKLEGIGSKKLVIEQIEREIKRLDEK